MDISSGDLLSIAAIVISVLVIIIGYCIHVELRFKKLEDEIKLFKTFKERRRACKINIHGETSMTLSPQDFNQMQWLLGKAKIQGLQPNEENELRNYIVQEDPSAKNKAIGDLIAFGLILVGIYLLAKALEKE
jgi:hypothetical protein